MPPSSVPSAARDRRLGAKRAVFADASDFSNIVDVNKLAGGKYKLYLHPLPISIRAPQARDGANESKIVLCGFRSSAHVRAETLALPYNHLIWGSIILLAASALIWPVLKIWYMSAKERLRHKHAVTLILSTLLANALLTLIALNLSYNAANEAVSRDQLRELARGEKHGIKSNIKAELVDALAALDSLSNSN